MFSFSSNIVVNCVTNLNLSVNLDVSQNYSKSVSTSLTVKSDVGWRRPVQLRFKYGYEPKNSPILIRFGDGGINPPVPVDNTIGIECGLIWLPPFDQQVELIISESSFDFETQSNTKWGSSFNDGVLISNTWQSWYSHEIIKSMSWFINDETRINYALNWVTPKDHLKPTSVNWINGDELADDTLINWIDVGSIYLNKSVNWVDGVASEIISEFSYSGIAVTAGYDVKWGFSPPKWVCSTNYRPPAVGLIKIRFSEPFNNTTSPTLLRFTASPEYCYYDDGGGSLNPFPDLPDFDFRIPIEPQIKRVYLMQPELTCVRVSDNLPIVITSVSIGDKRGQHTKSVGIEFSSRIDAERAANELLLISINGYDFYAIAEQPVRRELFGSATYSTSGRSRVAELSTPWSADIDYTNNVSRSFGGLLSDLLANSGWTVDISDITDFNIPTGAFSIMSKSRIEAVSEAARMISCMTLVDDVNKVIKILPLFPVSPWAMSGAMNDVNIHDAVIIDYNSNQQLQVLNDAVWVRGEQHGISAKVKRAGTAGNNAMVDFSSPLIVDTQAARLAGTSLIASTGNKELITINLPIMHDLPPLTKGMLVGVTYRTEIFKATLDSVNITASMGNDGLDVNQQIQLIRHLE